MSFVSESSYSVSINKGTVLNSIRTELRTDPSLLNKLNECIKNSTKYNTHLENEINWYKLKLITNT